MENIAFTVDAVKLIGGVSVPLLIIIGWLFNIHGRVSKLEGINEGQLVKRKSPMSLTKIGKKLLKDSGGGKYLENNKTKLFELFEGTDNAFDIQEKAKNIMRERIEKSDGFDEIKKYLFENGRDIDDIVLVMGLELRDMVLQQKGIAAEKGNPEPK